MASGSSAPYGDIIHVLGRPRCGLCCVEQKSQEEFLNKSFTGLFFKIGFVLFWLSSNICISGSVGTKFSLNSEELWVWLNLLELQL